ncbi:Holliday junction resolvase RuvX [Patescibacteria group bacterium]|nr:Holliday junction resolvase RuvX [Patescibacteria group bacterium]
MRYLSIDFGTKRVGLALSDEAGRMGFPHAVMPSDGRLIDYVHEIIDRKEVGVVVIGESRDFKGNENPVSAKAKAFARDLERTTDVTVEWEPETYTTQEAKRDPIGVHVNTREAVDASAAALILTSYLSRINPSTTTNDEPDYDFD